MEPNIFDKVHDIDLKSTMEKSYIDYAMSVIAARGPAGCAGRFKAGSAPCTLLNDRVEQRAG